MVSKSSILRQFHVIGKPAKTYGLVELNVLLDKFGPLLDPSTIDQSDAEWDLLREKLLTEFDSCCSAADVCQRLIRSPAYCTFVNLRALAKIALTIPLATAWPERGFSALKRIKTQQRNRIGDELLSALLNVAMNGPEELADEDALAIAKEWKEAKHRRRTVSIRTRPSNDLKDDLELADSELRGDEFEFDGFVESIDNDTFWL